MNTALRVLTVGDWSDFAAGMFAAYALHQMARMFKAWLEDRGRRRRLHAVWDADSPPVIPGLPHRRGVVGPPLEARCTLCLRNGDPVFRAPNEGPCLRCAKPTILRTLAKENPAFAITRRAFKAGER